MTETPFDDDLPDEEPYDPTGLELATEIAHQTVPIPTTATRS